MNKTILSFIVIVGFGIYAVSLRVGGDGHQVVAPIGLTTSSPSSTPISTASSSQVTSAQSTSAPSTPSAQMPMMTGKYKNGTYTGQSADAYYGNVQVKVTIAGGKINDVQFLDYPHDRSTSQRINSQAMPYLQQEAIQAQSAQVNGVSGATATSGAFLQSLSSALSQAV